MMVPDDAVIQIFCRAPIAGQVKTRLVPALGEEGAAALHAELATRMIDAAITSGLAKVELWCDPDDGYPFFDTWRSGGVQTYAQQGVDLGERMHNAIADGLARGAQAVILVGTDCPPIDASYLRRAFELLEDHDAVIGPAEDGGYGLIGLRRADPYLFENIEWGGKGVCAATSERFNQRGLYWSLLPLIWDVDRPEDILRYQTSKFGTR